MSGSVCASEATCRCSEAQFPLCAGVSVSLDDTNWGEKSGLISRQRRSWEKFAGKRQLLSQIFQHHDVTPGVWVSVSRLCHVSRVLITGSATWHAWHGPGPLPWLPSLRWHWSLISQDHSYLNFAANYPAGVISSPSHNIQGYCLFTLGS